MLARALAELEGAVLRGPGFDPKLSTRELTIALADADQIASLPAIVQAFAQRLPRARLRVVSVDTLVSSGGLGKSTIDVALSPGGGEDLHCTPLYQEEGVFVVRRDHPRIGRRLTREQFHQERHVDIHLALGQGGIGNRAIERAFARHGLSRDIAVTVPTFAAAATLVASTDWITGMPRRLAEALMRSQPIRIVKPPLSPMRFWMQMTWHDRTHLDPAAVCFRELLVAALGQVGAKSPANCASAQSAPSSAA